MKLKMITGIGANNSPQSTGNILNNITQTNVQLPGQGEPVAKRASDNRRSNKPIMEKRRRARINNCLNELKTLILDAMKKDPARHSKLEKADILEMTVKHLQNLQRQQSAMSQAADPSVVNKYKAGFTECANEVGRFQGLDPMLKRRLLQHLSNCINGVKSDAHAQNLPIQPQTSPNSQTSIPVHILPSPPSSPEQESQQHRSSPLTQITTTSNGCYLTNINGTGVQLIPAKLANGSIAFVLPQNVQQIPMSHALPGLIPIPIPSRTSSTASAASSNFSNYPHENMTSPNCYNAPLSPANSSSYESMDCHQISQQQQQQQPLLPTGIKRSRSPSDDDHPISLVIKKEYSNAIVIKKEYSNATMQSSDERPWRPW